MKKIPILELAARRTVILDGAMGTLLLEMGLSMDEAPEMWTFSHPEDIKKIHRSYAEAGADVILTNTFGATPLRLSRFSKEHRTEEINTKAAELARSACPASVSIAGDMGPTGIASPKNRDIEPQVFYNAYLTQARALALGGVDLFFIETQYHLTEALQALKAAKTTGLPVFVSMTFARTEKGFYTIMRDEAGASIRTLEENGADAVGANCTLSSGEFDELIDEIRQSTTLPLIAMPNAGQPILKEGRYIYGEEPSLFARNALKLTKSGVRFVGSCCGTTPEYTRAIRDTIRQWEINIG